MDRCKNAPQPSLYSKPGKYYNSTGQCYDERIRMKKFLIVTVIAIAAWGTWQFFGSGQSYTFSGTAKDASPHRGAIAGVSTSSPDVITGAAKSVIAQANQALGNAASSTVAALANAETNIVNAAKNTIDSVFESAVTQGENFLGITTGFPPSNGGNATSDVNVLWYQNNGSTISALVGLVVKAGRSISLVVDKSLFSGKNVQEIDAYANWQDGTKEHQKLYAAGGNDFLTHTFVAAGTYKPLFTFKIDSSTIQCSMIIVVQP
jgi:hypothetical protein